MSFSIVADDILSLKSRSQILFGRIFSMKSRISLSGSSDSFAIDLKGDCVIEEGNAFIPNVKFSIDDYYFYLAILSSNMFDTLLSIYSKQIMSGYDLGKIQIKNIPIPNVHLQDIRTSDEYHRLVEYGKELSNGNQYIKHVIEDVVRYYYPNY